MASQALLKAVTSGRPKQTRLLLQLGANVNCRDDAGQTPLLRALQLQDAKLRSCLLKILLKAGAEVGLADMYGRNALMWACRNGTYDDVTALLQEVGEDFDLNTRDNRGQTALWAAADAGKAGVVRMLVEMLSREHQSLEVSDYQGVTPAMRAAIRGHYDCLNILLGQDGVDATDPASPTSNKRRNITQLVEALGQNDQIESGPLDSPNLAQNPPVIRIISACGQKVMTLPRTPLQGKHDPDQLRISSSRGSGRLSRNRTWCSTPTLPPAGRILSPSPRLYHSSSSPAPSPVPPSPDGRSSSQSFRSGHSRGMLVSRDRSWTPDDHQDRWTTLSRQSVRSEDGRSSVVDMRHAGIFPSTPDCLSHEDRDNDVIEAGLLRRNSSVRASLPMLFEMSALQSSGSFRATAVPRKSPMSGSKTLRMIHQIRERAAEKARLEAERLERQKQKAAEEKAAKKGEH
ncbi:hypothetical protein BaRGS_00024068 [Batillaria attramentaria]|uniref:Uncharacterized protein n=1 Tax=Batillaria attramentaria TaxID=370345 RepID=A0ABD0KC19_9CAEN|nr:hypothetical protein BaRGS_017114 [Batillaria attramentaria]